jgi:hypothetical protein
MTIRFRDALARATASGRTSTAPRLSLVKTALGDRRRIRIYCCMVIGVFAVALGSAMINAATVNHVKMGGDFSDYWLAAGRMSGGHSPYAPAMLTGPIAAQGPDRFRYPPVFAQLLIPLSWLPEEIAAGVWLGVQAVTLALGLYIAAMAAGVRSRWDRAIAVGLAFALYLPIYDGLMKGNVEGPVTLLIALALVSAERRSGIFLACAALIKLVPGIALPALAARGRRALVGFAAAFAVLVIPSALLTPQAWIDYVRVLPNMVAGTVAYQNNLAPAGVLQSDPSTAQQDALILAARLLFVGAAVLLAGLSIWLARRPGGWPAALLAAMVASILAPGAIWYHYTVVLLPFVFLGWTRTSVRVRRGLIAALTLFTFAALSPVVSILAFAAFTGFGLAALWPRTQGEAAIERAPASSTAGSGAVL